MITRPITEIHEIELSSICNLACVYCVHPTLQREKRHMDWDVFQRSLEHVAFYRQRGTQKELSLTGIGEAMLHPRFIEALQESRKVMGDAKVVTTTNGIAVTDEVVRACREYDIFVYVSLHRPEVGGPAIHRLRAGGVTTGHNHAFVDSAYDWAGQIEWNVTAHRARCEYLHAGWGVVRQDGAIDACCWDGHGLHPIGHVNDELGTLQTHVIPLCATCKMVAPLAMVEQKRTA